MATEASPVPTSSTKGDGTGVGRPVPELDPALVARWHAESGELVELLAQARERLGGVAAVRLGPQPTVLVTAPQAVQHVLAQRPDQYVKRSHRARLLVGDGVLSATGDAWKRQRRLLQAQFTGTGMRRHEQRIAGAARVCAERWAGYARAGQRFDLAEEMRRFALDTIWRSLTGHPVDAATEAELSSVGALVGALPTLPADAVDVPCGGRRRPGQDRHRRPARHRGRPPRRGPRRSRPAARPAGGGRRAPRVHRPPDPRRAGHPAVRFYHETTATTLTWLYLLLDRHPAAREQALAAGPEGSAERREAVQALVHETLRLYPSAWMLPRHATVDDTLSGYAVAAGTDVLVCPYLTHRDPELWPDPERFDPRRFTTPGARPTVTGAYLPFGLGPRACLGLQFALRESTVLLERLLPAHTVAFDTVPTRTSYGITVRPDGPTTATLG